MTLEIQVLILDRHKDVVVLNWLMGWQPSIQTKTKWYHIFFILFYQFALHLINQMLNHMYKHIIYFYNLLYYNWSQNVSMDIFLVNYTNGNKQWCIKMYFCFNSYDVLHIIETNLQKCERPDMVRIRRFITQTNIDTNIKNLK